MPPRPQDLAGLVFSGSKLLLVVCLRIDLDRSAGAPNLLVDGNRNHRPVVARLSENRPLADADADDLKGPIVNRYGLSQGIHKREQSIDQIRTDHANIVGVIDVILGDEPASFQFIAKNVRNFVRVALDTRIYIFTAEFHASPRADRSTNRLALRTRLPDGFHVTENQILALLRLDEIVK